MQKPKRHIACEGLTDHEQLTTNDGPRTNTMDIYFILLSLAFFALTGGMVFLFDHL